MYFFKVFSIDDNFDSQHAAHLSADASEKALYVVSALVSSNHEGQQQFHSNSGVSVIRSLLAKELSTRQHRKVLNLITDLTDVDGEIEVRWRLRPLILPALTIRQILKLALEGSNIWSLLSAGILSFLLPLNLKRELQN